MQTRNRFIMVWGEWCCYSLITNIKLGFRIMNIMLFEFILLMDIIVQEVAGLLSVQSFSKDYIRIRVGW